MQISREGKASVEDQGDAVVAVAGGVDDLSAEPDSREKFAVVLELQDEIIVLIDLNVRMRLGFEVIGKRCDEVDLAFWQDQFCPLIFQFLYETGMIGMEVCDEQVFDLVEGHAFAF